MFRQLIQNNGYIHTQISVLIDDTYSRWYQLEGKTWEDFEGKTWLEVFSAELPIKEMTKKYDGSLYSTILQELEIKVEGKHDLKNEWLNVQIGVSESYKSATVYWHDWGDFLVRDVEYNEATDETTLLAYDKLILTHLEYNLDDLDVLYPLTAYQLVQAICSLVGLNLSGSFANDDIVITQDRFSNQGLAYRNVLDQIAEISGSVVRIENDELVIAQPTYYDTVIQEENLSELTIKGEVKQANILNLSREPQHDNYVFPLDWNEIPLDDRVEIVFADNQFVDYDRATYAESILDLLTYEYRLFEATSFGYGDIPVFAKVKVKDIEDNEYDSYITSSEIKVTNDIREKISADEPKQLKDKYALLTDNERELIRTALIVDKQNGVIQGVVENVGDLEELTSEMLIDINGLEDTVRYLNKGNIIPNLNGANGYFGWIGLGEALFMDSQFMEDMTFGMSAYPVETTNSSGYGWNFYNNGEMISNYGFILDNTENYSFKAKIENYQTTQIKVYEYDDEYDLINTTTKNLTLGNYQFTMSLDENTQYVKLGFLVNASYANQVLLTDMMFNQGQPKDYYATSDEAMLYAMTSRKQINNEIVDTVEEISKVDGKINNTTVQITAKDGVVIHNNNGKGLTILNDNGEKVIELDSSGNVISRQMTTIDMVAENANITGKITTNDLLATSGKIAGFDINESDLVGEDMALRPNEVTIGDVILKRDSETSNALDMIGAGLNIKVEDGNVIPHLKMNDIPVILALSSGNSLQNVVNIHTVSGTIGSVGRSDGRFGTIYLRNQPDVSSDVRYKSLIQNIPQELIEELHEIKPKMYRQNDKWHFGYIAQDVERALYKFLYKLHGRKANEHLRDYAFLTKDESYLSLLYGEIAVLKEQQLKDEINELKDRLDKLESFIKGSD